MFAQIIGIDGLFININNYCSFRAKGDGLEATLVSGEIEVYEKEDADMIFARLEMMEAATMQLVNKLEAASAGADSQNGE